MQILTAFQVGFPTIKGAIAGTVVGVGVVAGGAAIILTGGAATPIVLGVAAAFLRSETDE